MTATPDELVAVFERLDRFLEAVDALPPRQREAALAQLSKGLRSALATAGLNPQPMVEGSATDGAPSDDGGHGT